MRCASVRCRVVYCVLLISVDRYLIVYNPERSRCLCRPRWIWRYLVALVALVVLLQVPRLFEVTFTNDDRGIHNITKAPFSLNRFYSIYYAVDLLLHHTFPMLCAPSCTPTAHLLYTYMYCTTHLLEAALADSPLV